MAGADIGEVAYSDKEIRHNAKNANEMKFFFFKYRGGSRIRYGWGLIDRMIVCIDMVILAFLYRSPELQTFVVTGWMGLQVRTHPDISKLF